MWLIIHPLIRSRIYSVRFWHPMLPDFSVFILCVFSSFGLLNLR
ncbi:hypothetical protein GTPT_2359 [Tatumella ptyseos ATCC 33301]|uniref:Uncharacterized protein n=1 Tax=Tatumella ptyseos ATCC 33301 TaxID=1005995 RepID=A0A085JE26_9GAMM|nr:hypothetical protein GTPT_2359 [Tatumella ptyseos ATCC 33301]